MVHLIVPSSLPHHRMACFGHPIKHLSPAVDIAIILLSDKLFPHPLYLGRRRDSSDHTANHLAVTVTFLEAYKMGSDVEGATEYYNTLPAQPSAPSHNYQAANAPWDSVNDNIQSRCVYYCTTITNAPCLPLLGVSLECHWSITGQGY